MDKASLAELVAALLECKRASAWPAVRNFSRQGFARLWLHLVLERGMDPRRVSPQASHGYQAILRPYLDHAVHLGLGDRTEVAWDAPDVAALAARLWDQAKVAQSALGASQAPLLGLELSPSPLSILPEAR